MKKRKDRKLTAKQQQLVSDNLPLAFHVVNRMRNFLDLDLHEEMHLATIDLCRAASIFDPSRGYKFSTLATTCIRNGILGRKRFNTSKRETAIRPAKTADEIYLLDSISDPMPTATEDGEDYEHDQYRKALVKRLLALVDARSRYVLRLYYGNGWTLKEIGKRYGVSKERIRQILSDACASIRRQSFGFSRELETCME